MNFLAAAGAAVLGLALASASAQAPDDPFRSLEDVASPESQASFREQAAQARASLDRIAGRASLLARIRALSTSNVMVSAIKVTDGARVFYLKLAPGQLNPALYLREGLAGAERLVVDPERFMRGTSRAAIDWFAPSPDGRHVAYGVSLAGSEDSMLRVASADNGRDLPIEIDRTRFNADLAWHPDSRSFYYARIPEGAAGAKRYANIRLYRHVLGREAARDEIVFASGVGGARDVPEFVYPSLHVPVESRYAYAIARDGVRNELAVHVSELRDLAAGRPHWRKLAGYEDDVTAIQGWKDDLYLLSHLKAPHYRVLRVKAGAASLVGARVAVPEGDTVIQEIGLARDALYLRTMVGGVDRLERSPIGLLGMKAPEYVKTPFDNAITQLVTHPRAPGAILRMQGWIEAPLVVQVEAKGGNIVATRLQPPSPADFSAMDEVRLYAPSHDGARIPVTLIYRKSTTLTTQNPTLLVGYGSYGLSMRPTYDPARLAWLERGGIYAIAHVRGGGEYGEAWHEAGRRDRKVNTVLDFIAVAEFLVKYGFTNPKKLAIEGTGAGGIPVGGALVRRPDLFGAGVARVPVIDMLRFETMASGPANVPEFGSVSTPAGLEALRAISPYQQVKDGTAYPAVLLTAGINDPRIPVWQPAKMAARLQQATSSGKPVLLRVDYESGHGRGTSRTQHEEELADIYSFLLWQFGDPDFQPPPPPPPPPVMGPPVPEAPAAPTPDKAGVTESPEPAKGTEQPAAK
jgi:prolyl oligopeptidase